MSDAAPTPPNLGAPHSRWFQPWRAGLFITLLAAFLVCVSPAVIDWKGKGVFPDFICYWAGGKLLAAGRSPYDPHLQAEVQGEYGWDRQTDGLGIYDSLPFYYPPWLGLLFVPLAAFEFPLGPLAFAVARMAWFFLNLEFVLFAAYLLRGPAPAGNTGTGALILPRRETGSQTRSAGDGTSLASASGLLPIFRAGVIARTRSRFFPGTGLPHAPLWPGLLTPLFLFTVTAILLGQAAVFVFFVVTLSWRLLEARRDRAAGVALVWLSVKPQLTVILVFALLIWLVRRRRWRVIGTFFTTAAVLAAGSALVVPDWPLQMWRLIRDTPLPTDHYPWIGNAWLLVLKSLGLAGPLLWGTYLLLAIPFLIAVGRAALSPVSRLEDVFSLGALAAFFVAPYARHYDFPVLLIPLLVVVGRLPRPAGFALVALLAFAPYVQLFALVHYKEQQHSSVRFLIECTYFWVPLVLAAAWLTSNLVKKRVT